MGNLQVVKKAGAYNEEGGWVIPLSYDEITKLKTGVFVAKRICRSDDPPFKDVYHLYTEKGRLNYLTMVGFVTDVLYDEEGEVYALEITAQSTSEWHIVEIDYENNAIKKLYENSISELQLFSCNDCISLHTLRGTTEIFSRKLKRVIHNLGKEIKIDFVSKEGFILKYRYKKGFFDLEGVRILDYNWDYIALREEFITVVNKTGTNQLNYGLYTYEGKEVLPCKYWGMEYVPGIEPELCCVDGVKVWLFNTRRKENGVYYDELIKADGEAVLSISGDDVFMSDVSIRVYDGSNVIIKQKNKATLYKLEMNNRREIKAVVVCQADKIEKIYEYGQYRVYKGIRRGICNKNGTMIKPMKIFIRKEKEDFMYMKN